MRRLTDRLSFVAANQMSGRDDPRDGGPSPQTTLKWLTAGIAVGAFVALAVTLLSLYRAVPSEMELARTSAVARLRNQDSEIRKAFQNLESIPGIPCSPSHLAAMRSIVLRTYTVRDAAYRRGDDVLCSSGAGQIRVSIPQFGPPLFRAANGIQLWRNVELPSAPGIKSTILLSGNFSLMVAPAPAERRGGNPISTVLVNPLSGTVTTINGPPVNASAASLLSGKPIRIGLSHIVSECVGDLSICLVQVVGLRQIWREYSLQIISLTLGGAALGASMAFLWLGMLRKRSAFENRLRRGLACGEISLVYQPIVDLSTGGISGAEALMRWTRRTNDSVSPAEFIANAERTSLITDLTCFAVETASRELRNELLSVTGFVVSINIVPRDLADPRFLQALEEHIVAAGISPSRVALELTERQPIDTAEARATIKSLHSKGYKIYIDDFGTGHSNLSYLGELSIDAIKMDMIFTQSVGNDNIRARLVPSILGIAQDLGVTLIVEGIETDEQEKYFKAAGVRLAQGWHYGRAVPASEFLALTSSWSLPQDAQHHDQSSTLAATSCGR